MNRTVYPLRFKNKGWKIANKCAEIFMILLVAGATLSYRLWVWTCTAWYRFLRICVGIMCRWTIRRPLWRISPPAWKKRASTAALTAFGGIKRKIIFSKIEYCKKTPQTVPLRPLGVFFYMKRGTVLGFWDLLLCVLLLVQVKHFFHGMPAQHGALHSGGHVGHILQRRCLVQLLHFLLGNGVFDHL